jgi:hypothetical protein
MRARTSSFSFKGRNEDLRAIGAKLGVANLLEGSVRKEGNHLRITAQLINAKDGTHLWSQTFDRELTGVFAVQEEIAMAVSGALSIPLDVGEMSREKGGTTNVEASDKYLRARKLYLESDPKEAVQTFRDALALDPNFGRGWLGLYDALRYTLITVPETQAAARTEMAEVSAHIVKIAPNAWWAQAMRAYQLADQHKWSDAEAALNAAMASAPGSANLWTSSVPSGGRRRQSHALYASEKLIPYRLMSQAVSKCLSTLLAASLRRKRNMSVVRISLVVMRFGTGTPCGASGQAIAPTPRPSRPSFAIS